MSTYAHITLWLLFSFLHLPLQSQDHVGQHVDIGGQIIHDYIDFMDYNPSYGLRKTVYGTNFERGHYYDISGSKVEGLIRYNKNSISYQKNADGKKQRLNAKKIKAIVLGIDSFYVSQNFIIERRIDRVIRTEPAIVHHIASFDSLDFAKHYFFPLNQNAEINTTYLVRKAGTNRWTSFPKKKKKFKPVALRYFGKYPNLKSKIENSKMGEPDMMTLIKTAEYEHKYLNNESILFDDYWNETSNNKARKKAVIINKEDSVFTIEYYIDVKRYVRASVTSFYPNMYVGKLMVYNPDGTVRKQIDHADPDKVVSTIYSDDGTEQYEFFNDERTIGYDETKRIEKFNFVKSKDGSEAMQEVIKKENENDRIIHHFFKDSILVRSYEIDQGDTLFHVLDPDGKFNFKTNKLSGRLDNVTFNDIESAIQENAQGYALIRLVIDKKGKVYKYSLLNSIHEEVDRHINTFLEQQVAVSSSLPFTFKKYKINKSAVNYVLVIPFEFKINRFYRSPGSYYYDPFLHNPTFMQPLSLPTPPPMPPRF